MKMAADYCADMAVALLAQTEEEDMDWASRAASVGAAQVYASLAVYAELRRVRGQLPK